MLAFKILESDYREEVAKILPEIITEVGEARNVSSCFEVMAKKEYKKIICRSHDCTECPLNNSKVKNIIKTAISPFSKYEASVEVAYSQIMLIAWRIISKKIRIDIEDRFKERFTYEKWEEEFKDEYWVMARRDSEVELILEEKNILKKLNTFREKMFNPVIEEKIEIIELLAKNL